MKKIIIFSVTLITFLILAGYAYAAIPTVSPDLAKVTLRSQCEVMPLTVVTIKDVAIVSGPKEFTKRIGDIEVGIAPQAGQTRNLHASYIKLKISSAKLERPVKLTGSDIVSLVGKSSLITGADLVEEAKNCILNLLPKDDITYDIITDRLPRDIVISSDTNFEIRPRLLGMSAKVGLNTIAIDIISDGRLITSTNATFRINAVAEVLISSVAMKQGEAITERNSKWERRDISQLREPLTRSQCENANWVTKRSIKSDMILSSADVTYPLAVHKGDTVNLTVKCGAIKLTTNVRAKEDARIGQNIMVRCEISSEDVFARVTGIGMVEITR